MKKFVLGFLCAALLFTALPIGAAIEEYVCYKADYKVMVNGTEYVNNELPILNYKGNTYAPFRSILEAAGLDVNWNATLKQAQVTTPVLTQPVVQNTEPLVVEKPLTTEPITEPITEPPVEPTVEPEQIEYITFVYAGPNTETSIDVIFPEPMDITTATDVTNYKIYESDKTTLATFQPATASPSESKQVIHINLTSAFDKISYFYVEISPSIKNADGTKFVNVDKIQFAGKGFSG